MEDQINGEAAPEEVQPNKDPTGPNMSGSPGLPLPKFIHANTVMREALFKQIQANEGKLDLAAGYLMALTAIEGFQCMVRLLVKAKVLDEAELQSLMADRFLEVAKMMKAMTPSLVIAADNRRPMGGPRR